MTFSSLTTGHTWPPLDAFSCRILGCGCFSTHQNFCFLCFCSKWLQRASKFTASYRYVNPSLKYKRIVECLKSIVPQSEGHYFSVDTHSKNKGITLTQLRHNTQILPGVLASYTGACPPEELLLFSSHCEECSLYFSKWEGHTSLFLHT